MAGQDRDPFLPTLSRLALGSIQHSGEVRVLKIRVKQPEHEAEHTCT